jgi:hypothetical protein
MKIEDLEAIRGRLNRGLATEEDFKRVVDEAIKFHHKVSALQEALVFIKKQCQGEIHEIAEGKPVPEVHYNMILEYIIKTIEDTQHIRAA